MGINSCTSHKCPDGLLVDATESYSLSCKLAVAGISRHQNMNDIIFRWFVNASIPATKEPEGLSRSGGKRPDGLTLIHWHAGSSGTWDVFVTQTLAESYLAVTLLLLEERPN